jgi:transposase
MCPIGYYTLMRKSKDEKFLRFQMVQMAIETGNIAEAARYFKTTRITVYKWLKRYKTAGFGAMRSLSRRPKRSPRETAQEVKDAVIQARNKYKFLGAVQIKLLAGLAPCPDTIRKIWRQAGFKSRKRTKKHVTKQNLRNVKMKWKAFQQIDVDVKYLNDIPNYYIPMKRLNLPRYQYTARDVSSGTLFWAFAYEVSLTNSINFIKYVNNHLQNHHIDLSKTTIQTDNGSEFIGSWTAKDFSMFTKTIRSENQNHHLIPPGAHRFQSDVETFHNLEEYEFFDIEEFNGLENFMDKAYTYQLFFNFVRPNTYKENQCPWQIVKSKIPHASKKLLMLPPVILDKMIFDEYTRNVYDVSSNP